MSGEREVESVGPEAERPVERGELPVTIRPKPLLLAGLEELVERRNRFAASLASRPEQIDAIARVVFAHDAAAQHRFAQADELASYLRDRLSRAAG